MTDKDNSSQTLKLFQEVRHYFQAYGGAEALLFSPYAWTALLIALLITNYSSGKWVWYDVAISILPSLSGFSIGGYAVMLAFGDKEFIAAIRGKDTDGKTSPYLSLSASLAHFVLVQIVALVTSVVFKAIEIQNCYANTIGCFVFIYALLLAASSVLTVFFISRMYDGS